MTWVGICEVGQDRENQTGWNKGSPSPAAQWEKLVGHTID